MAGSMLVHRFYRSERYFSMSRCHCVGDLRFVGLKGPAGSEEKQISDERVPTAPGPGLG